MEYKNDALEVRMVVKDKFSVREQLAYRGRVRLVDNGDMYIDAWESGKPFITEWECPHVKPEDDIDNLDSSKATDVISWAGMQIFVHMQTLDEIDPNS